MRTDSKTDPGDIPGTGLWPTLKRTARVREDNLTDWAAALTYYAVLSLFPALIVLVSILGLFGQNPQTTNALHRHRLARLGPEPARVDTFRGPIDAITQNKGGAGVAARSSGSPARCGRRRATSAPSCAPRTRSTRSRRDGRSGSCARCRSLVTLVMVLLLALVALALVVTGPVAEAIGDAIGLGDTAVTVWDIAKWPVLLVVVIADVRILYYAAPNVEAPGVRWVTPGSVLALVDLDRRLGGVRLLRRATSAPTQDLRHARRRDRRC